MRFTTLGKLEVSRNTLNIFLNISEDSVTSKGSRKETIIEGWNEFHNIFANKYPVLNNNSKRWWTRNARGKNTVNDIENTVKGLILKKKLQFVIDLVHPLAKNSSVKCPLMVKVSLLTSLSNRVSFVVKTNEMICKCITKPPVELEVEGHRTQDIFARSQKLKFHRFS